MEIIGGVNKKVFNVENQDTYSFFLTHCLCFEQVLNLILSDETLRSEVTDLVFHQSKKDKQSFENIQIFPKGFQALNINMEDFQQPNVKIENKAPVEGSKDEIHNYPSLNKDQMVNNTKVLQDFIPMGEKNSTTDFPHSISISNEQKIDNLIRKVFATEKHNENINLENLIQFKVFRIRHSVEDNKPDISYPEKIKDKIAERVDSYDSEPLVLKFEEELKPTQEVRNAKHYGAQEHKIFHVKFENGDLRIRFVKDSLEDNKPDISYSEKENLIQFKVFRIRYNVEDYKPDISYQSKPSPIRHSVEDNKPDISYPEKIKDKIAERVDSYDSEPLVLKFEEELKPTQEVRNAKHYGAQEHKIFHVKFENGDLRIRFVKDSLSISLNIKEDIKVPSAYDSYRLIESLSQMGLRVDFFSINGKNLLWEFRQGQEGKKEGKFKDVESSTRDEKRTFSLYL